jgi:hypothetical protein
VSYLRSGLPSRHKPPDMPPRQTDDPPQIGFITDHLPLASFLTACGHEPYIRPTAAGTFLFEFRERAELRTTIADFQRGTARVEPGAYDAARIRLRKLMDVSARGAR